MPNKKILCLMPLVLLAMPKNLYFAKLKLEQYVNSGAYEYDQWQACKEAIYFLKHHKIPKKSAIVFDIDETLLSNYQDMKKYDFGGNKDIFMLNEYKAHAKTIPASKRLYQLAKQKGLKIFVITGRGEPERAYTAKNLAKSGYRYEQLIMWPGKSLMTIKEYKSKARCAIQGQGYRILINVGDQASDLVGPCRGDIVVKLPNPFYLLPANHIKTNFAGR